MSLPSTSPPLILTLRLDPQSQVRFNTLRKTHFPPGRNFLDAHLTLFHHLNNCRQTIDTIKDIDHPTFTLKTTDLKFLGAGVAYTVESEELRNIRNQLAKALQDQLIPQDRQGYRPHITIQNKVSPESAKLLLKELKTNFHSMTITALGLDLWQYLGGPWQHHSFFPFTQA